MSLPTFPGTNFDPVIEAYTKGTGVNLPALVYFDFPGQPIATWGGHYDLPSGGTVWQGLSKSGLVCGIEGLEASSTMQASDMTLTLSGADATLINVFSAVDRSEYVGGLLGIYGQFCDADWQPICPPFAYAAGIMGTATVSRVPAQDGNGWTRTISLPASNIFYGRSSALNSFYTDRDQQRRFPGDLFCSFVQSIQELSIPQPWR